MSDLPVAIEETLTSLQKNLIDRFKDNIICLTLYGSWAKGTARRDSDIDLLAIFNKTDKETRKAVDDIVRDIDTEKHITLVHTIIEDFQKEKVPLYTVVKKEGRLIYGDVDLSINPEPPEVKYSEFFKRSCEFESKKVRMAEEILEKYNSTGIADLCFVAAKHAIQAALAMKGEGYSSKVSVLLPLTEKHFGERIAQVFRKLFALYVKTEYGIEFLTEEEAKAAVEYAREVLGVYSL
jgi:predicted nucleotidyltransferase